jgi:hypothetical protein
MPGERRFFCTAGCSREGGGVTIPFMSTRAPIYAAATHDAAEMQRALRICLAGMVPPAALSFGGGDFQAWTAGPFLRVLAPHAMQARELALRGESGLLFRADAALTLPESSVRAGRELLERRSGARHLPVMKRFMTAIGQGAASGHFVTALALQSADFSIAVLPMLQCLLYCEWCGGQSSGTPRDLATFLRGTGSALELLPPLIQPHLQNDPLRFAAIR